MSETEKSLLDDMSIQAVGTVAGTLTLSTRAADVNAPAFRLSVTSSTELVKAVFDPVVLEQAQAYKELNESIRMGYSVPTSSTK